MSFQFVLLDVRELIEEELKKHEGFDSARIEICDAPDVINQ